MELIRKIRGFFTKEPEIEEEDEEELMIRFEKETGKNAVWGGKVTKQYKTWKNAQKD